jgi:hypothetical protein
VASAHGPVLVGPYADEAFGLVRRFPQLAQVEQPGQPVLDLLVATIAGAPAPVAA